MLHVSYLSISSCLFLFLIISTPTCSSSMASPIADLINSTCTACADMSTVLNYTFCVTALQAPASHVMNLRGLALLSMELALKNATATASKIKRIIDIRDYDDDDVSETCLHHCFKLYNDAARMVMKSVGAFLVRQFDAAYILMSSVMDAAGKCEEVFKEKRGDVITPLNEENYDLFEIAETALCIINLISHGNSGGSDYSSHVN